MKTELNLEEIKMPPYNERCRFQRHIRRGPREEPPHYEIMERLERIEELLRDLAERR